MEKRNETKILMEIVATNIVASQSPNGNRLQRRRSCQNNIHCFLILKQIELCIFKEEIQKNPRNPKNYGMTPFHFACENGHIRIAEFIMKSSIENNIDLNAKNSSDEWPLGWPML